DESGYRCHDLDLSFRLLKEGCKFEYNQEGGVVHIEHPRSIKSRTHQMQGLKHLAKKFPELETYVYDKIIKGIRYQVNVAETCESRFVQITDTLEGYRIGYSWITPLSYQVQYIWDQLQHIPFEIFEQQDNFRLSLGLHRNCWDYNIVVPTIKNALNPEVSVLIPLYNSGKKIVKSLSSVLLQSFQNFEVIIIDDASKDNSIQHVTQFLKDSRIRVISLPKNVGLSNVLNVGLLHSNAPIILQLDSDDWLEPTALQNVINTFSEYPDSVAVYGDAIVHSNGNSFIQNGYQIKDTIEFFNYAPYQVPRAYLRAKLIEIGGWNISDAYSGRYYEDRLMLASLSEKGKVKWLNKNLYNVSDRGNSLSRKNPFLSSSAKLSILWNEANMRGCLLNYTFNGRILKGHLRPQMIQKNFLNWSIIIPFRKGREHLFYSVKSWLESDFMNNEGEIIIVNDGSNEDLEEIKLLNTKRIKVIHCKENKGPANARNIGCKNAKYEMLFFSDSDHIVPPDILSKHSARHLKMPSEGIVIGCVFGRRTFSIVSPEIQPHRKEKLLELLQWNKDFTAFASMIALGKPVQFIVDGSISKVWEQAKTISFTDSWLSDWGKIILKFGEDLKDYQYRWTRVSTGSMSIKKSVFATIGGFDENLKSMEDWEFGIRTQKNNYSIVCAPEAEPFHQIHPVDETRNGNDQLAISILLSKHKGFIENLLNYKGSFAPPSYKFLKQVYKRNIRHQNSLIP
ncbi:MAG: glycosyltransferase, partial [Bacteroidota bacterium]